MEQNCELLLIGAEIVRAKSANCEVTVPTAAAGKTGANTAPDALEKT
jgi:hypothetical protein